MRRKLLLALKAGISLGLLAWVLHAVVTRDGVDVLATRLGGLAWPPLAAAAFVQLAAVGAGVLRWRVLLRAAGLDLPLGLLGRSYLMGRFVGTFTPSTAGLDVYRAWDVGRRTGCRALAAGTIVVEKLVGLVGLSLACVLLLPFGGSAFFGPTAVLLAAFVAAAAVVGLAVLRRPEVGRRLARVLPNRARTPVNRLLDALGGDGLTPRTLLQAGGLSLASHLLTSAVFVATAAALGLAVSPLALLVVGNAIVVATLFPVSVGGVGVREGVAVALLGTLGVTATDATLVALLGYFVGQIPGIFGGILASAGTLRGEGAPVSRPRAEASASASTIAP